MLAIRNRSRSVSRGRGLRRANPRVARSASLRRSLSRSSVRSAVSRASSRSMAMTRRNVHSFKRYCDALPVDITGTTYNLGLVFKLEDVKGVADFADLYDRYKLTTCVLRFKLVTNPDSTRTQFSNQDWQTTNWFPKLWYCPDYDDNAAETLDALKERAKTKCVVLRPNKIIKIVVKPAVTVQTYRTATSTGYAPTWNQWIDMANRDVPHYGLKFVVDCCGQDPLDTYPFKLEIDRQYYFTCKDVR
jgi:hypothetical protein